MTRNEVGKLRYTIFPSRIGPLGLAATDRGICRLTMNADRGTFGIELETRYRCAAVDDDRSFGNERAMLEEYFQGKTKRFDCPLHFVEGTDFQRQVWHALRRIPYGQVRSYAWVAREIGHPRAVRAVGGANGRNPIAILVPCHRVIRSDGGLGGFGAGPEVKRALLRIEGVILAK
ncbi:MAG: methylated-DNA--[protein]-cysteine S-methyltransferase [Gemmatimonadota bacterium]|nr:MAG: methylated-DNA--[protein]-cysteine S-methyltransferase [Gemmatimonadota bacterium]